jgi:microcystin degradation protein MlrC
MRILINECKQEISSFNPVLSHYEDFFVERGADLLAYHRTVRNEVGGALSVFDAHPEIEVLGGYGARGITSAGTLSQAAFQRIAGEFVTAVRDAGPLDGAYFALHGALAAEDIEDCEGYLLRETRKVTGDALPLVASFDLHGILTDRMIQHSTLLTLFHTNPHVDFYETGQRSARLLLRLLRGEVKHPAMVRVSIPTLVRGPECMTATGLFGEFVRRVIAIENGPGGLSGGLFIGNPFTDVVDLRSNVFLAGDGVNFAAQAEAIARDFWAVRERMQQPLSSLEESIRIAASLRGRVVLVDAADATSSGASGDSNAILAELLRQGCTRTALLPIVDAPAAAACHKAGVGAMVTLNVGGSLDPARFPPVEVTGRVRVLSDGHLRSESYGEAWYAGPTAVLECGPNTIVISTRPVSLYDRTLFLANGQDPANFDMTVVKSPLCQPRFFDEGAERRLDIDAPGATSANVAGLGHARAARPLYPLDPAMEFAPQAKVYGPGTLS